MLNKKIKELINWLNSNFAEGAIKKKFEIINGRKYIKVITSEESGSKSVYCFIDAGGNILKPNSWRTPHKTPRGSVFNNKNWNEVCFRYGVKYINGFGNL